MTTMAMRPPGSLRGPLGVSVVLHLLLVGAIVFVGYGKPPVALPPVYRVNLVAAPAGPRAIGTVNPPRPAPATAEPRPTRQAPPPQVQSKAPATKAAPQQKAAATPTEATKAPPAKDQPVAGGGPIGGRGADVANVRIDQGVSFPFQPYIDNIVRQIAVRFGNDTWPESFRAEFSFVIRRDGSIMGLRIIDASRGTSLAFKANAEGAIESAGRVRAFGPLPDGFSDDVLPVVFSFTPAIIR